MIPRSRFDAVLFDLDGVITKTARIHAAAWKQLFDAYLQGRAASTESFRPFDVDTDYRDYVDGKPRYDGVRSFLASRGIELPYGNPTDLPDKETVCGLGNRKNQLFHDRLKKEGVEVYKSSVGLIERLRQRGFKTAVVSASKNATAILDAARIADLFDASVDGVDAVALDLKGKPEPDTFIEAARRLNVAPQRCAVFEDAVAGVQAARRGAFGLVVGVDRGDRAKALKQAGADLVVKDLSEVDLTVRIANLSCALEAVDEIAALIVATPIVVFLDYDGTLTPIVSHPEDAVLGEEMRATVEDLSEQCPVAIVSGRGLKDVRDRVGIDGIYYAGSHGFEMAGPAGRIEEYGPARDHLRGLDEAQEALETLIGSIPGAQVERKKFSIAVHYRNVEEGRVAAVEEAVDRTLERHADLRKGRGKKVFELQPAVDWNKGRALGWLLEQLHFDRSKVLPLYIGDDLTDEDAFLALEQHGIGIVVGEGDRTTAARYRLQDPDQVQRFLRALDEKLGQRSAWRLAYEGFEPAQEGLREALCTLGNGYFATRGAAPESPADGVHYPGTYLAGGYNRLETAIAGRAIENEDLVNLPNWLRVDFRTVDGRWFDLADVEVLAYRQELDMYAGVLHREVHFRDGNGRDTRMLERRLVSMSHMHTAALQIVLTPLNWSGKIEIRSALDGRVVNSGVARYADLSNRHLEPVDTRETERVALLEVRSSQSKMTIAEAARTEVLVGGKRVVAQRASERGSGYIATSLLVDAEANSAVTIEKVVALYTNRDAGISECGLEAVKAVTEAPNFEGLLRAHRLAWRHLWRKFDLRLDLSDESSDHDVQRALRLFSFHLLQTASVHSLDIDVGMPSRGWHGEAYRGHIFWDEVIIFPFLNYRLPQITRALLMYRYRRLSEARKAARALGYRGAMFPWQSGSDGREETQQLHLNPRSGRWLPDHSHLQRHINAAVAYNIWQYFQVTGDMEFLAAYGAEMILEIARFWASIAVYNESLDRYEIRGVMGPDEFHDAYPDADSAGLNNNAYTNLMAVFVLNRALELFHVLHAPDCQQLCEKLGIEESEKRRWTDVARKMRLVFHGDGILSQFEGYERLEELDWDAYRARYGDLQRLDRILEAEGDTANRYKLSKQADVLMLFYLFSAEELADLFKQLGYEFEYETIPKNIDYYLQRTSNGSSLSRIIHSWVAARRDRAHSWRLFQEALKTDVADLQGGTTREGVHLGAMAGCMDLIQRCYTGLEARGEVLRLSPQFPPQLGAIRMHLRYRSHWLELEVSCRQVRVESLAGSVQPVVVEVKGQRVRLEEGKKAVIELE
jgi:alpha,alpha-trehalase